MHLSTRIGDFNIVQEQPSDDGDGAIYRVSSRQPASLERLLQSVGFRREIVDSVRADGTFHFHAGQRDLFDIMSALAETIDYDRFSPRPTA